MSRRYTVLLAACVAVMVTPAAAQVVREEGTKSIAGVLGGAYATEARWTLKSNGNEIIFATLDAEIYRTGKADAHTDEGHDSGSSCSDDGGSGGGCTDDTSGESDCGGPGHFCLQVLDAAGSVVCKATRPEPPPGWQRDPRLACVLPPSVARALYTIRVSLTGPDGACTSPSQVVRDLKAHPFVLNLSVRGIPASGVPLEEAIATSANRFRGAAPPTVTVGSLAVPASAADRTVTLTANVAGDVPVNDGTVTFTIRSGDGTIVGSSVMSGPVTSGMATASYVLPAGVAVQDLDVIANYRSGSGFTPASGTGSMKITPSGPPQVSIGNASVIEGTGTGSPLSFDVMLSWPSSEVVTVHYATSGHTAASPDDYVHAVGMVVFEPGATRKLVTVPLVGDALDEPDETLSLVLSSPSAAVLGRASGTGRIINDDGTAIIPSLDFNQDGSADLVWRNTSDGRVALWYMQGLTRILGSVTNPAEMSDLDWEIRAAGDVDGDWKPDLIWQHRTTGALTVWFFDGLLRTGSADISTAANGGSEPVLDWRIVGAADMDRDGQLDLVWQHETTGDLRIWHMSGAQQIDSVPIPPGVGVSGWRVVGVADMNADGWSDLVFRDNVTGGIAAWLMADAQRLSTEWFSPAEVDETAWRIVGTRDMNADGHVDLVWQHDDGRLAVWLMHGLTQLSGLYLSPESVSDANWRISAVR